MIAEQEGGNPDETVPAPKAADRPEKSQNQLIDEEIFQRDLNEVHLLMDFVSSLPGKSLNDLRLPDPEWAPIPGESDQHRRIMDEAEAVTRISLIRFPPTGTAEKNAKDAALLLMAKDCLNELARPSRGRTVAYTTLFAGGRGWFQYLYDRIRRGEPSLPKDASRIDLAQRATPELIPHVQWFKFVFTTLLLIVFIWLLFTAVTYWDIALGGSIVHHADQLEQDKFRILQANAELYDCATFTIDINEKEKSLKIPCLQLQKIMADQETTSQDLLRYDRCPGASTFWRIRCWRVWRDLRVGAVSAQPASQDGKSPEARAGDNPPPATGGISQERPADRIDASTIASILTVFSFYVLPMMFGVLGTLVATLRAVHDKIRDYLLAPRDLVLTLTGLPIGAIAGLAVGLFFSPSNTAASGSSGLTGGFSLTAGGLAFLAGYAADAFFSFLDSICSQVFVATNPPAGLRDPPARPAPSPSNPPVEPQQPSPSGNQRAVPPPGGTPLATTSEAAAV